MLRPGGRIGISDIVAADALTPEERAERGSYAGCIAGALSFAEYENGLRAAGLADISITPTHTVTEGMYSAIVKATKPEAHDRSGRDQVGGDQARRAARHRSERAHPGGGRAGPG